VSNQVKSSKEQDPLELFSPDIRRPVEGLLYLGKLSRTIDFCGHKFTIKTLLPHEKLAISLVVQPYRNTLGEADAFRNAHVGMAVTAIDGDTNFCAPIGPDLDDFARARLVYVTQKWYDPVIDFLWNEYLLLESEAAKAIQEIDRLSKTSRPNSSPSWPDSSNAQEGSNEGTASDIPHFTPFKFES